MKYDNIIMIGIIMIGKLLRKLRFLFLPVIKISFSSRFLNIHVPIYNLKVVKWLLKPVGVA